VRNLSDATRATSDSAKIDLTTMSLFAVINKEKIELNV
jgi:hypothetical protein